MPGQRQGFYFYIAALQAAGQIGREDSGYSAPCREKFVFSKSWRRKQVCSLMTVTPSPVGPPCAACMEPHECFVGFSFSS